jgi:hypothetical protein
MCRNEMALMVRFDGASGRRRDADAVALSRKLARIISVRDQVNAVWNPFRIDVRQREAREARYFAPSGLGASYVYVPRALPWADICHPFRARLVAQQSLVKSTTYTWGLGV